LWFIVNHKYLCGFSLRNRFSGLGDQDFLSLQLIQRRSEPLLALYRQHIHVLLTALRKGVIKKC
jgi:hypothetical protein